MPKYEITFTQETKLVVEAENLDALKAALDDETRFAQAYDVVEDRSNWEFTTSVSELPADSKTPAEGKLTGGGFEFAPTE